MPGEYRMPGVIVRGVVREVSRYVTTEEKKAGVQVPSRLGLKVRVEGEDYKQVLDFSCPLSGTTVPQPGDYIEVEGSANASRTGSVYFVGYQNGVTVLEKAGEVRSVAAAG